jgi:hypothetical protein
MIRRRGGTILAAGAVAMSAALAAAPAAAAEPAASRPTHGTCGWTTCTKYWSVARTAEFNAEEKALQLAAYGAAGLAGAAATAEAPPVALVIGAVAIEKSAEFDVQISSAANDHRCLIFKYPRGAEGAGWWGSVSPRTNENCQKANDLDRGVFGS